MTADAGVYVVCGEKKAGYYFWLRFFSPLCLRSWHCDDKRWICSVLLITVTYTWRKGIGLRKLKWCQGKFKKSDLRLSLGKPPLLTKTIIFWVLTLMWLLIRYTLNLCHKEFHYVKVKQVVNFSIHHIALQCCYILQQSALQWCQLLINRQCCLFKGTKTTNQTPCLLWKMCSFSESSLTAIYSKHSICRGHIWFPIREPEKKMRK